MKNRIIYEVHISSPIAIAMTDPLVLPYMPYMVTWIPSIYPSHVSINIPAPWIRHGNMAVHPIDSASP